ncbi:response regulator [Zavarzinia sp. CC-PAN008]|uniref:response regulator n=1 Tax=Zavarzinia sp. CC-PAN008 TaxID=3243332 RepID=UPI003F7434F0
MKVLVVEDEAVTAAAMAAALEDAGHDVIGPAANALDAMVEAAFRRPDLALVDINLEGDRAGTALAHDLRARQVPALFVTGYPAQARNHRGFALGCLTKPCTAQVLVASVSAIQQVILGEVPAHLPAGLELF